ncbi:nuclease-related domain-containing protein [Synechococcus sp. BDU 130192]|uniref:nuclease-related domain-containing protein n=1 Tax=Synechococcus sp. BDU 130192 TaxID=2042059 RepID=UPI0020B10741|nr:nuclease-related domain-containing protein [Synechococcus sp. BDU 130192]
MIIKEKDPIDANIEQLKTIINLPNLSEAKVLRAKTELKRLTSGNQGEKDSAYFIDFYYKNSPNWAIIHDLRIEHNGLVAQIDHILINRFLDFYILETKHYARGIKITEHGEFLVSFQKSYRAIESPIEQNKRHIKVLKNLLQGEEILPKRLGIPLQPHFLAYVLVSPKSRVIRPKAKDFKTDAVIKSDEFYKQTRDNLNNENILTTLGSITKIISSESLQQIAKNLVSYHRPSQFDYYKKFSISRERDNQHPVSIEQTKKTKYYCYCCKQPISKKVAMFCFNNKIRFDGKAYCFDCQKQFPLNSPQQKG